MEIKHLETKIIHHFNNASESEVTDGFSWYERAHNECILLSQVFELPLSKVVGVVSALSPNNKWHRNLHDTWNFLDKPHLNTKVCTFKNQRRKALSILKSDGTDSTILGILKGSKTQNFFNNILHYNSSDAVTVDLWAFRSVELDQSVKNFKITATAYKNVADSLGIRPHQLQAVVWGVVRGATA